MTTQEMSNLELAYYINDSGEYAGGYIYPGTVVSGDVAGVRNPRHFSKQRDHTDYTEGNLRALVFAPVGAVVRLDTRINDEGEDAEEWTKSGLRTWRQTYWFSERRRPDGSTDYEEWVDGWPETKYWNEEPAQPDYNPWNEN